MTLIEVSSAISDVILILLKLFYSSTDFIL